MSYKNIDIKEVEEKIVVFNLMGSKVKRVTIDRDTGNFMYKYWVDRDEPNHEEFVIVVNGVVVRLYFATHYEKETDTKIWTLEGYYRNGDIDKETVFKEVDKAVQVYGCHGFTNEMNRVFIERFGHDANGKGRLDLARFEK